MSKKTHLLATVQLVLLLTLFSSAVVLARNATLTTLTDETITGPWQGCTAETLTIGGKTQALENLREITFETTSKASQDAAPSKDGATSKDATQAGTESPISTDAVMSLMLVDGSQFQTAEMTLTEGVLQFQTTSGLALKTPVSSVQVILLKPEELTKQETLQTEWNALLQKTPDSDTLVVLREGSLQYYRGEILGMTDERVLFFLDGDTLKVKRTKILGMQFAPKPGAEKALKSKATLTDTDGSTLYAAEFLSGTLETLTVRLCCGLEAALPVEKLASVSFAAGKITYLDIANAESVHWTPFISVPGLSLAREGFYAPKTNRSLNGNPLKIGGKEFSRGLAMTSRSEVVFRLPENARRFQVTVGIDDEVRPAGSVLLTILADDTELFSGEITGADKPQTLDLDVSNRARLTIKVDYGQNMDISDHLDFGDARITP